MEDEEVPLIPLPGEPTVATKRRLHEADTAHERHSDGLRAFVPTIIAFATESLKVTMLVNGTAAGAMLAFIGAGRQDLTEGLITSLYAFCIGLLAGAFAHPASYIAQYAYQGAAQAHEYAFTQPYVRETQASKRWMVGAACAHSIGLALVFISLAAAAWGFWSAASSCQPMPASVRPPDMSTTTPGSR